MQQLSLKLFASLLLVAASGVLLAACGSSSSDSGSTTSGQPGSNSGVVAKVAYLANDLSDLTAVNREQLGETLKEEGGSLALYSAEFNPSKQLSQCQDAITSQRFNVLIITSAESAAAATCAKQAGEAGIGVIALEVPLGPSQNEVKPQLPEVKGSVVLARARSTRTSGS